MRCRHLLGGNTKAGTVVNFSGQIRGPQRPSANKLSRKCRNYRNLTQISDDGMMTIRAPVPALGASAEKVSDQNLYMVAVLCAPVTNCTFLSPNSFHVYASGTFLRNCTEPCSVNGNCSCQCTKRTNFDPLHNRHSSTDRQSLSQLTTSGRPTAMRSRGGALL